MATERTNYNVVFRLDHIDDSTPDKLKKFLDKYDRYICYKEIAKKTEKLHYQGYIDFPEKKLYEAAKSRWKSHFGDYASSARSFPLERNEGRGRIYVTKDRSRLFVKGYTSDDLEVLEGQSYNPPGKDGKHICVYKVVETKFNEWRNEHFETQRNNNPGMVIYRKIDKEELFDFVYETATPLKPWDERQIANIFRWLMSKYADDIEGVEYFHHNTKYKIRQQILGW